VDAADERKGLPPPTEYVDLLEESADDLYEHAPVGYFSSLLDGTIVKANATLLSWIGRVREDVVRRMRIHDLLAPGARIYYETHYAPLLVMQGSVSEIAVELVHADGERRSVLMTSTLVRDQQGRPKLVRTTAFDASDRRRYERELLRARADAEARARAVVALEHSTEGVLLVDGGGKIALVNPRAADILSLDPADAVGRAVDEALRGWSVLATRVTVAGRDANPAAEVVPLAAGDTEERWLSVTAVDAGDAVVYTLRDVTADRKLEQLRADLVTIVSHELRTPLTGVYGAAQTLIGRYDSLADDVRKELVAVIAEQTQRLERIVDQMLLARRLDTENVTVRDDIFDASDVFDTIVQPLPTEQRQRLLVTCPSRVLVRGDLDWLRQVIANLVDNALKYSDGGIRLAVEARDLSARFTVSDDGPGIPAGERTRVFEKFYRLDPEQLTGVGGTGLGLYIARELVDRMGGRISLLPRDRGTTFVVDLPTG
jgi:PAS domain S-box-containing protein